jgi:membrane-bound lytic murein transglycosylase D
MADDVTARVADNGRLDLSPEQALKRITVKAGKQDTVASLAKRNNVKPEQVAEWNKVAVNASFKAGQQVVLFVSGKARTGTQTASAKGKKKSTVSSSTSGSKYAKR